MQFGISPILYFNIHVQIEEASQITDKGTKRWSLLPQLAVPKHQRPDRVVQVALERQIVPKIRKELCIKKMI